MRKKIAVITRCPDCPVSKTCEYATMVGGIPEICNLRDYQDVLDMQKRLLDIDHQARNYNNKL